jgi:hypothetical protein
VHNPHPVKKETITWSGECSGGYATGNGTLTWYKNDKSNQQYTGEMKRGIPNGRGQYTFDNGTEEGIFVNGNLNGFGKIIKKDKGKVYYMYQGQLKDDLCSGYGEEIFFNEKGDTSSVHKGQFLDDESHGQGERKVFSGQFVSVIKGGFSREGVLGKTEIRKYYKGNLLIQYNIEFHDAENGHGESVQGNVRYSGDWKDEVRVGKGKLFLDSMLIYDGDWQDDKFNGMGERFFFDGSYYSGEFKENRRHGIGMQSWKDGTRYIGEFKRDVYSGYGYLIKDRNIIDCGQWDNGRLVSTDDFKKIRDSLYARYKTKILKLGIILD